jgi:hypothetical protein
MLRYSYVLLQLRDTFVHAASFDVNASEREDHGAKALLVFAQSIFPGFDLDFEAAPAGSCNPADVRLPVNSRVDHAQPAVCTGCHGLNAVIPPNSYLRRPSFRYLDEQVLCEQVGFGVAHLGGVQSRGTDS